MRKEVRKMDYKRLSEELMEALSDKELEPRPHFKILPNKYQEEEIEKIWEPGTRKNEIGYIITDFNQTNSKYLTLVSFFVRIGASQFAEICLKIEKSFENGQIEWEIEYPNVKTEKGREEFDSSEIDIFLPVNMIEEVSDLKLGQIRLKIVKKIKNLENTNKILFKLINNTSSEKFRVGRKTYEFGHLLEYKIEEKTEKEIITKIDKIKGYGLLPQIIPTTEDIKLSSITFLDYFIGEIEIPELKSSEEKISILSKKLKEKTSLELEPEIIKYFEEQFESQDNTLYNFQERAIEEITKQLNSERDPVVITARTAAGKTEAFIFPILNYIVFLKKLKNPRGIKTFLIYPRKALANDQLQRIVTILYKLNQYLDKRITIGIYHGDIEENISLDIPLPLSCVKHEQERNSGLVKLKDIRLRPTSDGVLECPTCGEKYDFVFVDRFRILTQMPDIVIFTPDVLNYILVKEPHKHQIFGKYTSVKICKNCRKLFPLSISNCSKCGGEMETYEIKPECLPEIAVLDELHIFNSLFGGNVSKLLKRLNNTISSYSQIFFRKRTNIQYIASSATIKNPKEFGKDFFYREISLICVSKEDYREESLLRKTVVFVSPTAYRMIDAIGWMCVELLRMNNSLKVLSFVNTRNTCDRIVSNIRHRFSAKNSGIANTSEILKRIDAHYSYLSKQERAKREEAFNEGDIRVLISTSTLEVGVDFKDIDCLILYSAPYSFNSYLQRVGRAGRHDNAIIFNVLDPANPIDLFYYRHSLEIVNAPDEFIEYPPFPKSNEKILYKHIVTSIFDFCSINCLDSSHIFFDIVNNGPPENVRIFLESLWESKDITDCLEMLMNKHRKFSRSPNEIIEIIEKDFRPTDLRKIEDHVEIEFESYDLPKVYRKRQERVNRRYKKAGLLDKDIETLNQIKRW